MTAGPGAPSVRPVDRRGRVALLVAVAVGLVGAVVLLRNTQGGIADRTTPPPTIAIAPTTVSRFAHPAVVLPEPGPPPEPAGEVRSEAGDRTLRLRWAQAVSGAAPRHATGYELRWGRPGALTNVMLVAAPEVELHGLTNGERYEAEVRSVDAYGRRSERVTGAGVPRPPPPEPDRAELTGLYDDFRGGGAPDPARWAVQRTGRNCLRAGAGAGIETGRLVLDLRCGNTEGVLRARVPLRLTAGPTLGRIMVVTDGPIPGGELTIAVVPEPVTTLGVAAGTSLPETEPGRAVEDPGLPPGTIRAVITAGGARIAAGPATPRTPDPAPAAGLSQVMGAPGVTARWDLRLGTGGVTLHRDGKLAASGDVLPGWTQASVLVGFAAPPGDSARVHVDAIGFTGEASTPPNVVDLPGVHAGDVIYPLDVTGPTRRPFAAAPGAQSARLQVVAGPATQCTDRLVADFELASGLPLVAAAPGAVPSRGPYCPYVAALPAELLDRLRGGDLSSPAIRSKDNHGLSLTSVLEVTYPPGLRVSRKAATESPGDPPDGEQHRLPHLSAELLNAAGERLVAGDPVPPGRVVIDVLLDGLAGQRETGELAGVAGIQIELDDELVAGLPTVSPGPAVAGHYQFGLSVSQLQPGSHVLQLRLLSTESGIRPRGLWLSFQVKP